MYDVKSLKADEFISDEEIQETLAYADANKDNVPVIDAILAKAKLKKGLTHREASVLLACEMPDKIQEMYDLAKQIKRRLLWKSYCFICSIIFIQLLCKWVRLLSVPQQK